MLLAAAEARDAEPAPELPEPPLLRCGTLSAPIDEPNCDWDGEGVWEAVFVFLQIGEEVEDISYEVLDDNV